MVIKMIKTLIVDDDFLVRMFLKQITDWEAAGFTLVQDACNGKEALAVMERDMPELIITDLSMPVMDGISLIRQIRETYSDIPIIVLSCHDEFEFVKEAMRLGADEYILKNLLDEGSLLNILESVRAKISKSAVIRQERNELHRLAQKGTELLLQELLEEISQAPGTLEKQRELSSAAGISYSFRRCAAVAATVEEIPGSILQPVCEQYCRNKNAVCLGKKNHICIILLDLSEIYSQADQWDRVNNFAEGLKNCIANYLNAPAAVGISSLNSGDGGIFQSVVQAQTALAYRLYGYRIYRYSELAASKGMTAESEILRTRSVETAEGDAQKLIRLGRQTFSGLRKAMSDPRAVREWFDDVMMKWEITGSMPETLDKMEECWLSSVSAERGEEVKEEKSGNRAINQAAQYIRKHFHEPISLSQVAEEVHLNSTYLSYLFKQEMGENFSDYLINCRLRRIKQLLHESNRPIKDCASDAGFQDYRNFCKLFKKETGMRPAEYRNLKK